MPLLGAPLGASAPVDSSMMSTNNGGEASYDQQQANFNDINYSQTLNELPSDLEDFDASTIDALFEDFPGSQFDFQGSQTMTGSAGVQPLNGSVPYADSHTIANPVSIQPLDGSASYVNSHTMTGPMGMQSLNGSVSYVNSHTMTDPTGMQPLGGSVPYVDAQTMQPLDGTAPYVDLTVPQFDGATSNLNPEAQPYVGVPDVPQFQETDICRFSSGVYVADQAGMEPHAVSNNNVTAYSTENIAGVATTPNYDSQPLEQPAPEASTPYAEDVSEFQVSPNDNNNHRLPGNLTWWNEYYKSRGEVASSFRSFENDAASNCSSETIDHSHAGQSLFTPGTDATDSSLTYREDQTMVGA
ncbi:hypothetical protein F4777DRAFT_580379 [Nemania sp. FL0916]|nr:hypothetical protein F4777DRAFT_580379 [Nemania sp. FL0916]